MQLIKVAITTDSSGDFSSSVTVPTNGGRLVQYRYVPGGGGTNLDTGADLTVTGATSGISYIAQTDIGTSAFTKAPRQPTHDTAGSASLYAAGGEPVEGYIFVGGEPLSIVVAQGGDTKSGTLYLWIV